MPWHHTTLPWLFTLQIKTQQHRHTGPRGLPGSCHTYHNGADWFRCLFCSFIAVTPLRFWFWQLWRITSLFLYPSFDTRAPLRIGPNATGGIPGFSIAPHFCVLGPLMALVIHAKNRHSALNFSTHRYIVICTEKSLTTSPLYTTHIQQRSRSRTGSACHLQSLASIFTSFSGDGKCSVKPHTIFRILLTLSNLHFLSSHFKA